MKKLLLLLIVALFSLSPLQVCLASDPILEEMLNAIKNNQVTQEKVEEYDTKYAGKTLSGSASVDMAMTDPEDNYLVLFLKTAQNISDPNIALEIPSTSRYYAKAKSLQTGQNVHFSGTYTFMYEYYAVYLQNCKID